MKLSKKVLQYKEIFILILFFIFFSFLILFGYLKDGKVEWYVQGKILDNDTDLPIYGASVIGTLELSGEKETKTTDEGRFHLKVETDSWKNTKRTLPIITVCKNGYYPEFIVYDKWRSGVKKQKITIYLTKNINDKQMFIKDDRRKFTEGDMKVRVRPNKIFRNDYGVCEN